MSPASEDYRADAEGGPPQPRASLAAAKHVAISIQPQIRVLKKVGFPRGRGCGRLASPEKTETGNLSS